MLIEIDDKVIAADILEKKFVCDLNACKGACCVQGDAGAPLQLEEIDILEDVFDKVKPYLTEEGIEAIEKSGVFYMDIENTTVTTLVENGTCAFAYFDESGKALCGIEKAYLEKKIDWKKPISCELFPIRVKEYKRFTALNYEKIAICEPACSCGDALKVPMYRFLKNGIIRAFGKDFYKDLEIVARELSNEQ